MPITNAVHSQQVYDPTDESIMAEQELCMERLYNKKGIYQFFFRERQRFFQFHTG